MNSIFNETSLWRVWKATQGANLGLITAFRNDRQPDENLRLSARLHTEIRQDGFGSLEVQRRFVNNSRPTEELFIMVSDADDHGRLKGFLRKHGAKYGQVAFILNSQLHHVNGKKLIEDIGDWHPERMDYYFSRLVSDSFSFVERIVFMRPLTFMTAMCKARGLPIQEEF
jgi:hypothetical protein